MIDHAPRLHSSYRHVWRLPDNVAGNFGDRRGPHFAWAAFGPRGSLAGVEATEGTADMRARAAEMLLADDPMKT